MSGLAANTVHAVGIGAGGAEGITLEGQRVLAEADVVYMHGLAHADRKRDRVGLFTDPAKIRTFTTPPRSDWSGFIAAFAAAAEEIAGLLKQGRTVAYAALGDINICSCFSFLQYYLEQRQVAVRFVPGVSYYSGLSTVVGRMLVEEGDRLCVLRCPADVKQLEAYLPLFDCIVLFTVPDLAGLAAFCRERDVPWARIAGNIGQDDAFELDLLKHKPGKRLGPHLVVLKMHAPDRLSDGAAELNHGLMLAGPVTTEVIPYRNVPGGELRLTLCRPETHPDGVKRGAVMLFHGGGWKTGSPEALRRQCEYLASLGLVTVAPEYRIRSKYPDSDARACVEDAAAAIRWLREHAARFDVDPALIAIGGGSSGGHIALCALLQEPGGGEPPPRALVLLNPVTDVAELGFRNEAVPVDAADINPIAHLRAGLPPTIVLHGTDDRIVPMENSTRFAERMHALGNTCTLHSYPGRGHAFFNHGRSEFDVCFYDTLAKIEAFLRETGVLPPAG